MTTEQQPFRLNRPFNYVRVRLWRGASFEYIKGLFEDERESLLAELAAARQKNDAEEAERIDADLRLLNAALQDVYDGEIDLMGPA